MKADSHKHGRGQQDTVTAEDVSVVAKGKLKAGKGKAPANMVAKVILESLSLFLTL